jgi:hypothetical protein
MPSNSRQTSIIETTAATAITTYPTFEGFLGKEVPLPTRS